MLVLAVYSNLIEVTTDTASSLIAGADTASSLIAGADTASLIVGAESQGLSVAVARKVNVHCLKPINFELITSNDAAEIESLPNIIDAMSSPTASPSFRGRSLCPYKSSSPILYHSNTPVMLGTVPIYLIWYGTWTMSQHYIVGDFFDNLSNSDWLNIQTTYYQKVIPINSSPKYTSSSVKRTKEAVDLYSQGKTINDNNLQVIISRQLNSHYFPVDTNALYFVLTSPDVFLNGFCSTFCGYHTSYTYSYGKNINYAFVGNPTQCPGSCAAQSVGPNGDAG